jgi:hypothetical protein
MTYLLQISQAFNPQLPTTEKQSWLLTEAGFFVVIDGHETSPHPIFEWIAILQRIHQDPNAPTIHIWSVRDFLKKQPF